MQDLQKIETRCTLCKEPIEIVIDTLGDIGELVEIEPHFCNRCDDIVENCPDDM